MPPKETFAAERQRQLDDAEGHRPLVSPLADDANRRATVLFSQRRY